MPVNTSETPQYLPSDNPRVPKAEFPFRHHFPLQIRFTDIDMMGHLNNNVYLSFMDMGKFEYFRAVQNRLPDIHNINMVVVHIDIDFFAPTFFGEQIEVWTTVTHLGEKSFQLEQRIVSAETLQTKSVCSTVMSGFDPALSRSIPIPQEWIDAVTVYEGRPLR